MNMLLIKQSYHQQIYRKNPQEEIKGQIGSNAATSNKIKHLTEFIDYRSPNTYTIFRSFIDLF